MPESRRIYKISALNLDEINRTLSQLAERLDQMEGYRGNPRFQDDVIIKETEAIYFGEDADYSWRIVRTTNDISFQRKESGVWVEKGEFTP